MIIMFRDVHVGEPTDLRHGSQATGTLFSAPRERPSAAETFHSISWKENSFHLTNWKMITTGEKQPIFTKKDILMHPL